MKKNKLSPWEKELARRNKRPLWRPFISLQKNEGLAGHWVQLLSLFNDRLTLKREITVGSIVEWSGFYISYGMDLGLFKIGYAYKNMSAHYTLGGWLPYYPRKEHFLGWRKAATWLEWGIGGAMRMRKKPFKRPSVLFKTEWLSLRKRGDYIYAHEEKSNGRSVAVLVFLGDQVLVRFERCPAHLYPLNMEMCSITGQVEPNESFRSAAARELLEETGYTTKVKSMIPLGTIFQSKQSDTKVQLFAFQAKSLKAPQPIRGDGTPGERGAFTQWVHMRDAIDCMDPLMGTMISRLKQRKLWSKYVR